MKNEIYNLFSHLVENKIQNDKKVEIAEQIITLDYKLDDNLNKLINDFVTTKSPKVFIDLCKFLIVTKQYINIHTIISLTARLYRDKLISESEAVEYLSNITLIERQCLKMNEIELIELAEHIYQDTKEGFGEINECDDSLFNKLINY